MELIGRQFGHIRVTDVVGEGGMGAVYAGHDEKLDRKVALKVLHSDQRLDVEARERLLREARALSKVDHPNICRIHDYIETGDVDLLVLEFIDGRTLQSSIDEGLPYSEKLRIAVTIAEVLVRAHRAGIVHRDLKPENVMLTRTGDVKVLDFGLARWLHRKRSGSGGGSSGSSPGIDSGAMLLLKEEGTDRSSGETLAMPAARFSDISPSGRREFLATAVGITLGTPLYMSPEQARGESLTPASDMFSFGLLLQVLFTGKEPHSDLMSAREVILRVARGDTNPVEGAPKAITALINDLKQFAPADRPTAVETVERLRFLIATPQRIARRAIAGTVAGIMLIGGWRYTVDLQHERAKAVAAQLEAERQRGKAEDMIEFILGDLRKKLEPVGRLDVLDDAAQRALTYADELKPETSSAAELARNSKALNQLVEVRIAQGKLQDALHLANRSQRLTFLAVNKAPQDGDAQLAYATSHYWLGYVYRLRGDHDNAMHHWKEYASTAEKLAKQHPSNETYQLERAYGHSNIASLMEDAGNLKGALGELQLTVQAKSERLASAPADTQRRADVAVTLNKMGWVQQQLGQYSAARATFGSVLATYDNLRAADPSNQTWKDRLSRSHSYLSRSLESLGELTAAESHVRSALQLQSELYALDSANTNWKRNLAVSHNDLSSLLRLSGQYQPAVAEGQQSLRMMSSLVEGDPARAAWRLERASVAVNLARALLASKRTADAATVIAAARQDVAAADTSANASLTRATIEFVTGEIHRASGNLEAARRAWTAAAEGFAKFQKRQSESMNRMHLIALLRLGRDAEAAPLIEQFDRSGYRHPEYLAERGAPAGSPPATSPVKTIAER